MIIPWSTRLTNEMMVIQIIVPRDVGPVSSYSVYKKKQDLQSGLRVSSESSVGFPDCNWTSLGHLTSE